MFMNWESFCEKIRQIELTGDEADFELALLNTVFDPVKSHVHAFGFLRSDCVVG